MFAETQRCLTSVFDREERSRLIRNATDASCRLGSVHTTAAKSRLQQEHSQAFDASRPHTADLSHDVRA